MANNGLQGVGMILGVIGIAMLLAATVLPYWRQSDKSTNNLENVIETHEGLWSKCFSQMLGQWRCDAFENAFLGLPPEVIVSRYTTIGSLISSIIGLLVSFIALKCISVMSGNPGAKKICGLISGISWIVSSVLIIGAASYYARLTIKNYQKCMMNVFGSSGSCLVLDNCIFLGWGSGVSLVLGGIFMILGSITVKEDEYRDSRAYNRYSQVKRSVSNRWQRVINTREDDKTYV